MKQNDNLPNETVVRLRQAIRDGKISVEVIEGALKQRVEEELKKPYEEIDGELVSAMLRMLDDTGKILRPDEKKVEGQSFEELMAAVDRLDTKPARKEKPKHSRLLRVAVVLPVVLICMIVYDVFIGPKGFDISHTDDGQQRIVSNVTQAPVILGESYARIEQGRMISNDIDEVKSFLGYHPPVPYRLSDEWHLSEIVASSNELWDVLIVNYEKNGATELLVYNYTRFYASQRVEQFTEQDKEGESMNTPNGLTVYVTQNVDSTIGAWETDNEAYYINGPISVDEILSVIDEITNAGG